MKFKMRTTAPSKDDFHYYGNDNPYVRGGYPMPNCTTYAIARYWELCGKLLKPLSTHGYDATTVFYHCKNDPDSEYKNFLGQEPKVGAIACWSTVRNDNPQIKGSTGHLGSVERVEPNKDIYCSNSAYKSTNFYMKTYKKSDNYQFRDSKGRLYYLQGFIYPTVNFDEEKPAPAPQPEPPKPVETEFKVGDRVVVSGYATSNSDGGGNRTSNYGGNVNDPTDIRYVTKITDLSKPRPYHISEGQTLGDRDKGWVSKEQIKKI